MLNLLRKARTTRRKNRARHLVKVIENCTATLRELDDPLDEARVSAMRQQAALDLSKVTAQLQQEDASTNVRARQHS